MGEIILTDIVLSNLLRDLDISTIYTTIVIVSSLYKDHDAPQSLTDSSDQQATVQTELHVRRPGRLGSGGRDVLADIRSWDQHLRERDGVVRQEEER